MVCRGIRCGCSGTAAGRPKQARSPRARRGYKDVARLIYPGEVHPRTERKLMRNMLPSARAICTPVSLKDLCHGLGPFVSVRFRSYRKTEWIDPGRAPARTIARTDLAKLETIQLVALIAARLCTCTHSFHSSIYSYFQFFFLVVMVLFKSCFIFIFHYYFELFPNPYFLMFLFDMFLFLFQYFTKYFFILGYFFPLIIGMRSTDNYVSARFLFSLFSYFIIYESFYPV
jgi:hypothetical protein